MNYQRKYYDVSMTVFGKFYRHCKCRGISDGSDAQL